MKIISVMVTMLSLLIGEQIKITLSYIQLLYFEKFMTIKIKLIKLLLQEQMHKLILYFMKLVTKFMIKTFNNQQFITRRLNEEFLWQKLSLVIAVCFYNIILFNFKYIKLIGLATINFTLYAKQYVKLVIKQFAHYKLINCELKHIFSH